MYLTQCDVLLASMHAALSVPRQKRAAVHKQTCYLEKRVQFRMRLSKMIDISVLSGSTAVKKIRDDMLSVEEKTGTD